MSASMNPRSVLTCRTPTEIVFLSSNRCSDHEGNAAAMSSRQGWMFRLMAPSGHSARPEQCQAHVRRRARQATRLGRRGRRI